MISKITNILKPLIGTNFSSKDLEQRGIVNTIQYKCKEKILELTNNEILIKESTSNKDIQIETIETCPHIYNVDIKSHSLNKVFSTNLISVEKLRRFYTDSNNHIIYIFVDYTVENLIENSYHYDSITTIRDIKVKNIENIQWGVLQILNKGQLQIRNANKKNLFTNISREEWLKILITEVIKFKEEFTQKWENFLIKYNKN